MTGPVYRTLGKDGSAQWPTIVVAGSDRRRAWLYVHGPTPTVLRLHRPVGAFLQAALADIVESPRRPSRTDKTAGAGGSAAVWMLPPDEQMSYPGCVVIAGPGPGQVWLYVLATSPSAVRLRPPVVAFLLASTADLPAGEHRLWPPVRAVGRMVVAG
jgi:hypothetical protein